MNLGFPHPLTVNDSDLLNLPEDMLKKAFC